MMAIPSEMKAAVYTGESRVEVQSIPCPELSLGEVLIKVDSCGICHTDLKKVEYNLLPPPRVFGHETAGQIVAIAEGVEGWEVGDRVVVFHHIPCGECFYCQRRLYAQCAVYKKVGVSAGFEPAGGGFSQYVRVMDWIVRRGMERIPDDVSYEVATFVEPLNTCLKAVVGCNPQPDDVVVILGQGPIGLIFTMLVQRLGACVVATDMMETRLAVARRCGAQLAMPANDPGFVEKVKALTAGRGADIVIVAASAPGIVDQAVACSRPGAKIALFAQTSNKETIAVTGADLVVAERMLVGYYSADVDLQAESARLVFSGELPLEELISHRVALPDIHKGIQQALHPDDKSLKIIVQPQRWSE
ncbi:MAG: alcohol dehydrogenase catalytic domain-containing protein [Bryobacterales bacterium]|nr:alcohol dehydrogenase catalytic domain-containing protein [Bryobacterales bacterium]